MNLFSDDTKEVLQKYMTEDWAAILSKYLNIDNFEHVKNRVSELRKASIVYPDPQDVFKVFRQSYENIKVVAMGQDPYHNGNSDGLILF